MFAWLINFIKWLFRWKKKTTEVVIELELKKEELKHEEPQQEELNHKESKLEIVEDNTIKQQKPKKKLKKSKKPLYKPDYTIIQVEDFPDEVKSGYIYVVGEEGYKWVLAFKCPCGCNDIIQLNLLKETKPSWKIIQHRNGTYSISPSVDRFVNCKSHFTINNGLVSWWGDQNNFNS
jgi:hypothetical protein